MSSFLRIPDEKQLRRPTGLLVSAPHGDNLCARFSLLPPDRKTFLLTLDIITGGPFVSSKPRSHPFSSNPGWRHKSFRNGPCTPPHRDSDTRHNGASLIKSQPRLRLHLTDPEKSLYPSPFPQRLSSCHTWGKVQKKKGLSLSRQLSPRAET